MRSSVRARLAPPYFQSLAEPAQTSQAIFCRGLCRNPPFCSPISSYPPAVLRASRGPCASPECGHASNAGASWVRRDRQSPSLCCHSLGTRQVAPCSAPACLWARSVEMRGFTRWEHIMLRQHFPKPLCAPVQRKNGIPRIGIQRNDSFARLGLALANGERSFHEVNVAPAQLLDLAAPHCRV